MTLRVHIKDIKILVNNNQSTIRGFLHLSVVRGTQIILGLVTTYFLARALTIEQYGEYQFILNVIGILTVSTLTEFNNTLMQSIARGYTGSFRRLFPYPLIGSLGGSCALVLFALWYGLRHDHQDMMICFLIAAFFFPLMHGLTLWRGLRIGEKNFSGFAKIEMTGMLLSQLSIIAITQFYGGQYIGVLLAFMGFPALINLIMLWRIKHLLTDKNRAEDRVVKHGTQSSLYVSLSTASIYFDKLLLFFFLPPSSLALFTAADRFADLLRTGVQDVATALAPKFAESESYSSRLHKFFKIFYVLFGIILMIFAFTLLPWIIVLIYGEAYKEAIPYAQILVFSVALGNLASMQFRYIRSKLDTSNFRNIMIGTSLIKIILSITLIPFFGLEGAVLSAVLYRIVLSGTINYVIQKDYKTRN